MPIRGSPNGARHLRPQAGRDRPESVVAINRNAWSQSIGTAGRDHPVRAAVSASGIGVWFDGMDGPLQTGSSHIQLTSALHPKWAVRKALRKQNTGMLNQL